MKLILVTFCAVICIASGGRPEHHLHEHSDVAIIIPSRLHDDSRLYQKALRAIGHFTVIQLVWKQVQKTGLPNIYVATDSEEIGSKIRELNGEFILTHGDFKTGSDRVHAALRHVPNHDKIKYVINVQGDLPFVKPETILDTIQELKSSDYDIVTPVIKVHKKDADASSKVKVVKDLSGRALYFSRSLIPHGAEHFFYHIGIYAFRKEALKKFVEFPQCDLEKTEKLEQLRALENGMSIGVVVVLDDVPISINTPDDLEDAQKYHRHNTRSQ